MQSLALGALRTSRRRFWLLGALGLVGLALVLVFSARQARAATTVTLQSATGCPVATANPCSYSNVATAVTSAVNGGSALSWNATFTGLPQSMTITGATVATDATHHSVALTGVLSTPTGGSLPVQLTAVWGSAATPVLGLAVKPSDGSLASLNALWTSTANPTLTGALVATTNVAGGGIDPTTLPSAAQSFYPAGFAGATPGNGASLFAGLNVAGTSDPALKNVLTFLGVGQTATVQGTVAGSIGPVVAPGTATATQSAGLSLMLSSTSTGGAGSNLPTWLTSRTVSASLTMPTPTSVPAVSFTDTLNTSIGGQANTFTGSFGYDPAAGAGGTVSASYGVASGSTLHAPGGLGALTLSNAKLALSATVKSPVQFSGDFTANATVNTKTVGLDAHLDASSGTVAGDIAVTSSVTASDATALGNQLLGTSVAPDAGSAGNGLTLSSAQFSFAAASGASKTFALTASTSFRGATADVLASITQPVGGAAKLFLGVHAANLSPSALVANPSPALAGLTFPTADLFVSKGYATNGQATDVPTASMTGAQQTFFTKVYGGTLPTTVSFGPNLTFDGTLTLPDAVNTRFGVSAPVTFSGALGFGLDGLGSGQAPAMSGSLSATLPALTQGLPAWVSGTGPWTVALAADSNHNVQLSLGGTVSATVNGSPYTATVSGALASVNGQTTFDLTGNISGTFKNLFGLSWLSVTNPTVSLHVAHGTAGSSVDASLRSDLTINNYALTAEADISSKDGQSAQLTVTSKSSTATVGIGDVLSYFGATAPSGLPTATLNSLSARVGIVSNNGTSATLDVVADTSISLPSSSSSFDSTMLLQIAKPAVGPTTVLAGFQPHDAVTLSDFVSNPSPDFAFPSAAILVATQQTNLSWANLLPAEQAFFSPFCGDGSSACHTSLAVPSGISIATATNIPASLNSSLDQMGISHTAPVLATGTLPVFGQGALNLHVALPAIPGTGPDFFDHGQLSLDVGQDGVAFNGAVTFNVPKGSSVANATSCTTEGGVWRTPRGGSSLACYDQVPFSLSAAIKVGVTTSFTLTGGMQQGYRWVAPMGQQWLSLNSAVIQLGVTASPDVSATLGFQLGATIANHDFAGSILASLTVGGPTGVTPNLVGLRLASGSGLSTQDLVDLATATGTQVSLQQASLPNIAVRNVLLSFSQVDDPALCLKSGVHIAGDLYINPGSGATTINSSDCQDGAPAQNRATICSADSSNGCMAGVDVAIDDKGIHASGVLGGFTAGPLVFSGAKVDLEIGSSVQHLLLAGQASINGFAQGSIDLLVGPTQTRFRGSAALFGSGLDAYLDGTANLNLQHLSDLNNVAGFNITAVLKSQWLNQAGVALSGTLAQLKPVVQTVAAIILDLNNGDVVKALFEIPNKAAQLGISLPAPYGPIFQTISSDLTTITNGIAVLGKPFSYTLNGVMNGFDINFPGIPGIQVPQTCITTWSGGSCYTTPPWHTIFGTVPGIPGVVVPATCITTTVNGTCYSVPPIQGIHVPGICNALQSAISGLTCDNGGIAEDLIFPVLKSMLGAKTGANLDGVTLNDVLNRVTTALGNGQTFSIDCAEFQASVSLGSSPSANVSLASHMNVFGNSLTPQISWNFAPNSSNVGTAITQVLNAIIHPDLSLNGTCALPADWSTNPDFPDVVGTGPTPTTVSTPPVLPPPPTMTAQLANPSMNEGSTAVLNGTISPTPNPARSVTVNWGDGSSPVTVTTGSDGHFTASHPVLNNTPVGQPSAQYNVTATAGTLTSSAVLTVANVAPYNVTAVPSRPTVDEGSGVTVTGGFSDPGADPHSVAVDWGDGHSDTVSLAAGVLTYTSPQHVYVDNNGTQPGYPVTVTVTDDDLASGTATFTENVANVAPKGITVTQTAPPGGTCPPAGCAFTTPEQQAVPFHIAFSDPGTLDTETAVIDWGDGQTTTVPAGTLRGFDLTHVWTEADSDAHPDGNFPVRVTVTDKDGAVGTGGATEAVSNVAPTNLSACLVGSGNVTGAACPTTATISEGGSAQVQGNFTDVSAADTHTVTIDWGAGWPTAERYQTIALPVGTFTFNASRQYGDDGTFPIVVTVADDDNASVTTTSTLTVTNVAPGITINRATATTVQGVPGFIVSAGTSLPMQAHATDPGNDALGVRWNWADGSSTNTVWPGIAETTPSNPHVAPQDVTDNHAHTFASPCVYAMSVAANDGEAAAVLDQADAIVVGTNTQRQSSGWWQGHLKTHPTPTMLCQLTVVQRMSAMFAGPASKVASAPVPLLSAANAVDVLQPRSGDDRLKLRREILAMWLDFSDGSFGYNQQLDTNRDGKPDTAFSAVMANAEAVALNAKATSAQLGAQRQLLAGFVGD